MAKDAPFYQDPVFEPFHRLFKAGTDVLEQGGKDGNLGILLEGELEVRKDNQIVGLITKAGAIVGEMSLILGTPYTSTVRALTDIKLILIPRQSLNQMARNIPEFSVRLMRTLAARLEDTNKRLAELEDRYDALYRQMDSDSAIEPGAGSFREEEEPAAPAAAEGASAGADWPSAALLSESTDQGRQPLLVLDVLCVAHKDSGLDASQAYRMPDGKPMPWGMEIFPVFGLRKGSQKFHEDAFGLTEYHGAEPGYAPMDYTLQEVYVCPVCLFASNQADNFLDARKKMDPGIFSIRRSIRTRLSQGLPQRKALVDRLPDARRLFGPDRGLAEGMIAFELAIMTARSYFDFDAGAYSNWGFRIVTYLLKQAQLQRRHGSPDREKGYLAQAYEIVQQHISRFSGAQYFYAFFLLVALSGRLEGAQKAAEHFERFTTMRTRAGNRLTGRLGTLCEEFHGRARRIVQG